VLGVSLLNRDGGFEIALRQREYCAGQPRLAGFDVFALRSPTEELLTTIADRCDRLGIQRTEVRGYPGYGAGLDIPDPDGTLVRIIWHDRPAYVGPGALGRGWLIRRVALGDDGGSRLRCAAWPAGRLPWRAAQLPMFGG
jgi:hypothetical protein